MIKGTEVDYLQVVKRCRELDSEGGTVISVCPGVKPGRYLILYSEDEYPEAGPYQSQMDYNVIPPETAVLDEEEDTGNPFFWEPDEEALAPVAKEEAPLVDEKERDRHIEENNERLKRANVKPDVLRGAGVRETLDRLKEKALAHFDGDQGFCKAWILSEVPGLDPTKGVLTQLCSEDMLACLAVLDSPGLLGEKQRELRREYRRLRDEIRRHKPGVHIRPLVGDESVNTLKQVNDSLRKNLEHIKKEPLPDGEIETFFDAERMEDEVEQAPEKQPNP